MNECACVCAEYQKTYEGSVVTSARVQLSVYLTSVTWATLYSHTLSMCVHARTHTFIVHSHAWLAAYVYVCGVCLFMPKVL